MATFDFKSPEGRQYTITGPDGATVPQAFSILQNFRQQYPQYSDMADGQLADAMHAKFYSDMPRDQFNAKIGLGAQGTPPPPPGFQIEGGQQPPPLPPGFQLAGDKQPAPQVNQLADVAQSGLSGLEQGTLGLAGMAGTLRDFAGDTTHNIGAMFGASPETIQMIKDAGSRAANAIPGGAALAYAPSISDLNRDTQAQFGDFYQPQTTAGKYARTIGEFLPGAIGGPEALATRLATRAAVPAVASEALGQATEGTPLEPVARVAGGLLGGYGGSKLLNLTHEAPQAIPSAETQKAFETSMYQSPEVTGLRLSPDAISRLTGDIKDTLLKNKIDIENAPGVVRTLNSLERGARFEPGTQQTQTIVSGPGFHIADDIPVPASYQVSDIDLARQSLSDLPLEERRAAAIARKAIDRYLGNIPESDVIAGDAQAANRNLLDARATHAALKRAEDVTDAMGRAENQAGSTYSGANVENATRQQLRAILNEKQGVAKRPGYQDYTPQELAALKSAVNGSFVGNRLREAGNLLGGGGGLGMLAAAGTGATVAHEGGADWTTSLLAGLLSGATGKALKGVGNRMAVNRASAVDELLRSRSPLGKPIAAANAQLPAMNNPILSALISGQLTIPQLLSGNYNGQTP